MSDPIDLDSEVERLRAENGDMRWRLNQLEPLAKRFAADRDNARSMVSALVAEVERLRADLDRALTDGAASHGRYLAADSDYRYQSEKAARHWQERCQAITERDHACLALAMARGEGWPEGWARYGLTWWSPDGQTRILHGERFVPGGTEPAWTLERGSRCVVTHHPDALSALRASRPTVKP